MVVGGTVNWKDTGRLAHRFPATGQGHPRYGNFPEEWLSEHAAGFLDGGWRLEARRVGAVQEGRPAGGWGGAT